MNKLLVICGPTATGKTALGVKLAQKFDGEIISADSRQVYKEMDIGTGKDLPINPKFQIPNPKQIQNSKFKIQIGYYFLKRIPVWLYDLVEPDYQFSVADYIKCAHLVIEDIWKKKKLPILVGGTGFYIKGVIDGIETLGISPDWELRWCLKDLPAQKLYEILAQLDLGKAALMNASDRKNPRRLIRAIEIASKQQTVNSKQPKTERHKLNTLFIGLIAPFKILYQRIDQRVEERARRGVEDEARELLDKGYTWGLSALGKTIGYKEWQPFFEKRATGEEVIERWKFAEHAYARRQMTWFKKDKRINWFDIISEGWEDKVEDLVRKWYSKDDAKKD